MNFFLGGDLPVNRLGYGAMRLCAQPGNFGRYPDWEGGKRLLHRAVELGINFIDTAHAYGPSCNEELIAEALAPYPAGVVIATKGGVEKSAADKVFPDGRPENLRRRCEESLLLLRLERIDLYQLHRPDPNVPFADSVGALAELQRIGLIRHVGLSNVTIAQIEEARGIVPIASVQNRYNLIERGDDPVVDYCAKHGIAYLPCARWRPNPSLPRLPWPARVEHSLGCCDERRISSPSPARRRLHIWRKTWRRRSYHSPNQNLLQYWRYEQCSRG